MGIKLWVRAINEMGKWMYSVTSRGVRIFAGLF
jgi:hypothetical protein